MPTDTEQQGRRYWAPRFWTTWIGVGALRLIFSLPERLQIKVGKRLGSMALRFAHKRRHIAEVNLRRCFPDATAEDVARLTHEHFENLGLAIVETARAWWGDDALFSERVEFEGLEHLHEARQRHAALVVITGHFTTLEISGRYLKQHLAPFDAMYRAYRSPLTDELIRRGRLRSARALIEKSDIRAIVRSLREGVNVWYAPDQNYRRKFAAKMTFFNQSAMTNTATSRLVTMGKAGLIPCYCFRTSQDEFRYRVRFEPEIPVASDADAVTITRATVDSLEAAVRAAPSQYFWVHRRFKSDSPDEEDVYG